MRKPVTKPLVAAKAKSKPAAARAATPKPGPAAPKARRLPAEVAVPEPAAPKLVAKEKAKEKPAKAASKGRTEPLNFRVTADFRRAFKRAAAAEDCKKVELLERIFSEWSARNPA